MKRTRGVAAALAVLLVPTAAACGDGGASDGSPRPPRRALVLDFDSGQSLGSSVTRVSNKGSASAGVSVRTVGGGELEVVQGPDASRAVRFRPYTGSPDAPAAVLVVTPRKGDHARDALDPGNRDFTFGATFSLDAKSDGVSTDNGDNLLQRGSYDDPAQYKLQLDGHHPSCLVTGDQGRVDVEGTTTVQPGRWYTVTCTRADDKVTLSLVPYGSTEKPQTWEAPDTAGTLSFGDLPLSVGGKVHADGSPRTDSLDQFNGSVDDVYVDIR